MQRLLLALQSVLIVLLLTAWLELYDAEVTFLLKTYPHLVHQLHFNPSLLVHSLLMLHLHDFNFTK